MMHARLTACTSLRFPVVPETMKTRYCVSRIHSSSRGSNVCNTHGVHSNTPTPFCTTLLTLSSKMIGRMSSFSSKVAAPTKATSMKCSMRAQPVRSSVRARKLVANVTAFGPSSTAAPTGTPGVPRVKEEKEKGEHRNRYTRKLARKLTTHNVKNCASKNHHHEDVLIGEVNRWGDSIMIAESHGGCLSPTAQVSSMKCVL